MSTPAPQPVADWLEKLGLGQYAQRFSENEIDFSILADLTDQDLEKIGVAPLGHRRKYYIFTDNEFEPLINERFAAIKQGFEHIRGIEVKAIPVVGTPCISSVFGAKGGATDEIFGKGPGFHPAPTFSFSSASALLCASLAVSAGASEMPSRKSRPFLLGAYG
jgi:hypothetical protein